MIWLVAGIYFGLLLFLGWCAYHLHHDICDLREDVREIAAELTRTKVNESLADSVRARAFARLSKYLDN